MKKKLLAMLLVLVMVLSLVACGSKDKASSKKDDDKKTTQSAESNENQSSEASSEGSSTGETEKQTEKQTEAPVADDTFEAVVNAMSKVDAGCITVEGSMNGVGAKFVCYSDEKNQAKIIVNFGNVEVTDIIYTNKTFYINVKNLATFADTMAGQAQFVPTLTQLGVTGDYISMSESETEEVFKLLGDMGISIDLTGNATEDAEQKKMADLVKTVLNLVKGYYGEIEGDFKGSVVKIDNNYAEIVVDSNNIDKILTTLKTKSPKKYMDQFANKYNELFPAATEEEKLEFDEKAYMESIQDAIDTVDDFKAAKPEVKIGFGVVDGNIVAKFDFKMTEEGVQNSLNLSVKSSKETTTYAAPTSTYKLVDLLKTIKNMQSQQQ